MLTDEEIFNIAMNPSNGFAHGVDAISFARDIERAVLAKAMQKQEPVAHAVYQGCLSGVHVSMLANAPKDFSGYLYSAPQPAQAAAIPDKWRQIVTDLANELESDVMVKYTLEHLKYPSQKAKFDADMSSVYRARSMLSASPKPE